MKNKQYYNNTYIGLVNPNAPPRYILIINLLYKIKRGKSKLPCPSEKNDSTLEQTERTQKALPVKKYDLSREKCGNTRGKGER